MKWYVLKVASNKEESVKEALQRKIVVESVQDMVGRVVVPVERIKSVKGGKQRIIKRKLYPGYVFMELETEENGRVPEKVWFMIRETNGVGDFIGSEGKPTPMRDTDVAKMLVEIDEMTENSPSIKVEFEKGDMVKIREGAFENFEGVVDEIDVERGVVRVNVSIFGRSTPLDIEYWQIEKQ
ncbi:Transcription termination/antitermination protein NusG [Limihaloglobus sulfuriphilus]|uniref:Transcription termination/antitermination protein NusG n=1 Tax=Limihaloglobus sulfuriphilus TaxID=1851148 RepID=A0A1Q2MFA5_9BACT|nr:transcription termination/antitermination protein NusG [Limihaloglobus sulfuriphilus]AQQ71339.1 Transcription termination/antitermination protein NusG [Limihaloglobus sulfuriphilus]